jgi:hypothetical protein
MNHLPQSKCRKNALMQSIPLWEQRAGGPTGLFPRHFSAGLGMHASWGAPPNPARWLWISGGAGPNIERIGGRSWITATAPLDDALTLSIVVYVPALFHCSLVASTGPLDSPSKSSLGNMTAEKDKMLRRR